MRNGKIVSEVWLRDDIDLVLRALAVAVAGVPVQGIEAQAYRRGYLDALRAVCVALVGDRCDPLVVTCTRPLLTRG